MFIFITLLITFVAGIILLPILGGIGIGIAILSCGDIIVWLILVALLYKRHRNRSKD